MDLGKKRFKTLLENEAGIALVRASYDGESLLGLSFLLPSLESIYLDLSHKETDSLLGEVQAICDEETRAVFAYVGSVDWHKPASIPAVDCPGKLPLGVGSALLNFLASQAHKAHKNSMVYRGPYPTANLFETLMGETMLDQLVKILGVIFWNPRHRFLHNFVHQFHQILGVERLLQCTQLIQHAPQ